MHRRHFLKSLAVGLAALHLRFNPGLELPPAATLLNPWYQTTRLTSCYSDDYLHTLNSILASSQPHALQATRIRPPLPRTGR